MSSTLICMVVCLGVFVGVSANALEKMPKYRVGKNPTAPRATVEKMPKYRVGKSPTAPRATVEKMPRYRVQRNRFLP